MAWQKDRPYSPGEREFHLTGLRMREGEEVAQARNDDWMVERADKLWQRHGRY